MTPVAADAHTCAEKNKTEFLEELPSEILMSKNPVVVAFVVWTLLLSSSAQVSTVQPAAQAPATSNAPTRPMLEDGTPVKLRIGRTVSSADAHVGDTVDFEVLEEIKVGNIVVAPKGGAALATVTEAKPKGHMGKGGKLDINIDYVRLIDGEKPALRGVKDAKGGGHAGAMTGAMVATSLVFFPAAPLFLFMHGKDITIPKGTEVTAYVNGNFPIDLARFQQSSTSSSASSTVPNATTELEISSTPARADISIDGNFAGNTPSTISVPSGEHVITVSMAGYQTWERKLRTSGGHVKLAAMLQAGTATKAPATNSSADSEQSAAAHRGKD